ncbi:thioesterase II family protein [Isoptericola sp. 178]|uniref:thioesterase II family protein n=1 Tax=Isoptericola sp. 178 TaxID=3064651 RepID=UPI00271255D2|nr:alpha/beta fold hydrolase [Isoptericola sp. 178]MDO8145891.1 alpha/beta fold hydrolase [Isoptericola sp. 178]
MHDAPAWFALYPYGGGGVASYRPMAPMLVGHHTHVPELPGRDRRHQEAAHTTFPALADDLWRQLAPELEHRDPSDLVLFGYSLGGMMAAEMARRVEAGGGRVRALVVGGAAAPDRWDHSGIADLTDDEFVARFRRLGIAPAEVLDDEWMVALFMSVWRADARVAESIVPARDFVLGCPVHAVVGDRDPLAGQDDVEAWARIGGPGSSWATIRGDHGTMIRNPVHAARLLRAAAAPARNVAGTTAGLG